MDGHKRIEYLVWDCRYTPKKDDNLTRALMIPVVATLGIVSFAGYYAGFAITALVETMREKRKRLNDKL